MGNPNKAKGDETERVAKRTLRELGFPWTEKTRAGYERDAGDLHLVPMRLVIAQCKFWRSYDWKGWLAGLKLQKEEAQADHAFLIIRRPGMPAKDARGWLAVMPLEEFTRVLRQAGYGDDWAPDAPYEAGDAPPLEPHWPPAPEPVEPPDGYFVEGIAAGADCATGSCRCLPVERPQEPVGVPAGALQAQDSGKPEIDAQRLCRAGA